DIESDPLIHTTESLTCVLSQTRPTGPPVVGPGRSHGHETIFGRRVPERVGSITYVTRSDKAPPVSFSDSSGDRRHVTDGLGVSLSSVTAGSPLGLHSPLVGKLVAMMAASSAGNSRELDQTPTWAVASVCAVIIVISIVLEKGLHRLGEVTHQRGCSPFSL
ncbi:hypothetical protein GW17_00036822, partial [Ensete ventricosum]